MTVATPRVVADVERYVRTALDAPDRHALAVLDGVTGEVRGPTSLDDVAPAQQRREVGHASHGRQWWGGPTDPACRFLPLRRAFEEWGMHRVAFRADARNIRSIAAVCRLAG